MLESFILVLSVCGTLYNGSTSCDEFVVETEQTHLQCLQLIETVYNNEPSYIHSIIADARNDWFNSVNSQKLHCVIEDKE